MPNFIRFVDQLNFQPIQISDKVRDYYAGPPTSGLQPLRVKFAATHAGKVTRNNGFYLPNEMKNGAASWTNQYAKPVLLHHEDQQDAVGRVIAARYVDISVGIRDFYKKRSIADHHQLGPSILDALTSGSMSFKDTIDVVNRYLINDHQLVEDADYEGLGYIELTTEISDADAIQKILDKRYLTGSVGVSTTKATCSVCRKDWASEERCEHRPGKHYEDKLCVLIAGKLMYDEYSLVNKPADRHSKVIEVNVNGVQDFVKLDEENQHAIIDTSTTISLCDAVEEGHMPEQVTQETTQQTDAIQVFWGDEYSEIVGDDRWGKQYAEMIADAIQAETDPEVKKQLKDAKLTAAARKKLSSSVFCGPDRSYPVNDCGHAKSAMAYAKKYNESSSVMACIRRKASRLGCPFQDEVQEPVQDQIGRFTPDYFDRYSDAEILQMQNGIAAVLDERHMGPECDAMAKKMKMMQAEMKSKCSGMKDAAGTAECNAMSKKMKTMQAEMKRRCEMMDEVDNADTEKYTATQDELKSAQTELRHLQDQYADLAITYRKDLEKRLCMLSAMQNKEYDENSLVASFKDKSLEDIKILLTNAEQAVDLKKVHDIFNKDTVTTTTEVVEEKKPVVVVEDPTLKIDNTSKENKDKEAKKALIMREYLRLSRTNKVIADRFMDDARAKGLV